MLANAGPDVPAQALLRAPRVRAFFQQLIDRLAAASTGSSSRIEHALLVAEAPSFDKGEVTDKGSINQRAVLTQRATLVDAIFRDEHPDVIRPVRT